MTRSLRRGCALLTANLSAHATANMCGWRKNDSGEKLYFPVDRYLEERAEQVSWCGIDVINYPRPLSGYVKAFLASGLILELFEEPAYSEEAIREDADLAYDNRVAFFVIMRWRKPKSSITEIHHDL